MGGRHSSVSLYSFATTHALLRSPSLALWVPRARTTRSLMCWGPPRQNARTDHRVPVTGLHSQERGKLNRAAKIHARMKRAARGGGPLYSGRPVMRMAAEYRERYKVVLQAAAAREIGNIITNAGYFQSNIKHDSVVIFNNFLLEEHVHVVRLNLQPSMPFLPGKPEASTVIQINGCKSGVPRIAK